MYYSHHILFYLQPSDILYNVKSSSDTSTLRDAVTPFSNDNAFYVILLLREDWIYVMRIGFILDDNMNGIHADYFFFDEAVF